MGYPFWFKIESMKSLTIYSKILIVVILISLAFKLNAAFAMSDKLFVGSDDLGYIKSAKLLLKTGILSFHQENVPTVWITPAYPLFLAPFYAFFSDSAAATLIRIMQALVSSLTIWLSYRIGKQIRNELTGLLAAVLIAFYPANWLTANLILSETLFTFFLVLLVHLAIAPRPAWPTFVWLGAIWAVASLLRPTIAMLPALFFLYYLLTKRFSLVQCLRYGTIMFLTGVLFFSPWWIRNAIAYDRFIPFTYSDGAPLLEGSFPGGQVDRSIFIEQNPDKIYVNDYYKQLAAERIRDGFRNDFPTYLKWYAYEKPKRLLTDSFYWIALFDIYNDKVKFYHNTVNVLALAGLILAARNRKREIAFLLLPIVYFTVLYSIYFAFDRYGYPQFTLVSIIAAYALTMFVCKATGQSGSRSTPNPLPDRKAAE